MSTIDEDILFLFENAIGVQDTIWYTEFETLYEAIMRRIHAS